LAVLSIKLAQKGGFPHLECGISVSRSHRCLALLSHQPLQRFPDQYLVHRRVRAVLELCNKTPLLLNLSYICLSRACLGIKWHRKRDAFVAPVIEGSIRIRSVFTALAIIPTRYHINSIKLTKEKTGRRLLLTVEVVLFVCPEPVLVKQQAFSHSKLLVEEKSHPAVSVP
jgi:hypothetical protein